MDYISFREFCYPIVISQMASMLIFKEISCKNGPTDSDDYTPVLAGSRLS